METVPYQLIQCFQIERRKTARILEEERIRDTVHVFMGFQNAEHAKQANAIGEVFFFIVSLQLSFCDLEISFSFETLFQL
jgi:hypothetical protein